MPVLYLVALVAALGVFGLQIVLGGHGHAGHDLGHGHEHGDGTGEGGIWTLFLSLRFWLFAGLGFGLSGTLLHYLTSATPEITTLVASVAGLGSGLFAVLAFRLVRRGSATTEGRSSLAVGKVGRVVVPCGVGVTGKVRIEIGGSSVDLIAIAEEELIATGEAVLVEDLREGVATVSRRPEDLA